MAKNLMLTCEHGGNQIPNRYRKHFKGSSAVLKTHRGFDIGALNIAKEMQKGLNVSLCFCVISRLLIDTNRPLNSSALFSEFAKDLNAQEKQQIIRQFHTPHWQKVTNHANKIISKNKRAVHIAVHSMTDKLNGKSRPMQIALLYDSKRKLEKQFATLWIQELRKEFPNFKFARNNPYNGADEGLMRTLRGTFSKQQYLGLEFEINQKLLNSLKTVKARRLFSNSVSASLARAIDRFNSPTAQP